MREVFRVGRSTAHCMVPTEPTLELVLNVSKIVSVTALSGSLTPQISPATRPLQV